MTANLLGSIVVELDELVEPVELVFCIELLEQLQFAVLELEFLLGCWLVLCLLQL